MRLFSAKSRTKGAALGVIGALTFAFGSLVTQPAFANGAVTGKVAHIYVSGSLILIKMDTAVVGKPTCATDTDWDFSLPLSNQAEYSLLLTAKLNSAVLQVYGLGTCALYGAAEDLNLVYI
jgi:hypothetical protein